MKKNNAILLVCTFILLLTSGWYILVVHGGIITPQTRLVTPIEVTETSDNEEVEQAKAEPVPTPLALAPIPQTKVLSGGKHMLQTFNNCGPASLSMALSYFDYDVSQQALGQQLRPYQNAAGNNDDKSVTLQELAAKGEEYGLVSYHRAAGNIAVIHHFIANDIPVITRTWLEPGEDIGHYRVIKGYSSTGKLIQDDSLQGANLSYTNEEFLEIWKDFSYEFLVLVPQSKVAVAEAILESEGIGTERQAWEKALAIADETLVDNPNYSFAHFNRSVALYHLGRYQESVVAYEIAAPELPMRTLWYQIEPIQAYYESGDMDIVLSLTESILNNHNRAFSELYYLRSRVYSDLGESVAAAEEMRKAEQYNSSGSWRENI